MPDFQRVQHYWINPAGPNPNHVHPTLRNTLTSHMLFEIAQSHARPMIREAAQKALMNPLDSYSSRSSLKSRKDLLNAPTGTNLSVLHNMLKRNDPEFAASVDFEGLQNHLGDSTVHDKNPDHYFLGKQVNNFTDIDWGPNETIPEYYKAMRKEKALRYSDDDDELIRRWLPNKITDRPTPPPVPKINRLSPPPLPQVARPTPPPVPGSNQRPGPPPLPSATTKFEKFAEKLREMAAARKQQKEDDEETLRRGLPERIPAAPKPPQVPQTLQKPPIPKRKLGPGPTIFNKKVKPVKYKEGEEQEAHPLVRGFRIEHFLRDLARTGLSETTRSLAKNALNPVVEEGGDHDDMVTQSIHNLHDSLMDDDDPRVHEYNLPQASMKIHHDNAVGAAIKSVADAHNEPETFALARLMEHHANQASTPQTIAQVSYPTAQALEELRKHITPEDLQESFHRHMLRQGDAFFGTTPKLEAAAKKPSIAYHPTEKIQQSTRYAKGSALHETFNKAFNDLADKMHSQSPVSDINDFKKQDHFEKLIKSSKGNEDKASDLATDMLYGDEGKGLLEQRYKPENGLLRTFNNIARVGNAEQARKDFRQLPAKLFSSLNLPTSDKGEEQDYNQLASISRVKKNSDVENEGETNVTEERPDYRQADLRSIEARQIAEKRQKHSKYNVDQIKDYLLKITKDKPEGVSRRHLTSAGFDINNLNDAIKQAGLTEIKANLFSQPGRAGTRYFHPEVDHTQSKFFQNNQEALKIVHNYINELKTKSKLEVASQHGMKRGTLTKRINRILGPEAKAKGTTVSDLYWQLLGKNKPKAPEPRLDKAAATRDATNRYREKKRSVPIEQVAKDMLERLQNKPSGLPGSTLFGPYFRSADELKEAIQLAGLKTVNPLKSNSTLYFHPLTPIPEGLRDRYVLANQVKDLKARNFNLRQIADQLKVPLSFIDNVLYKGVNAPKKFGRSDPDTPFTIALRKIKSTQQEVLHKIANSVHNKLKIKGAVVKDAIYDTPESSVANTAQKLVHNDKDKALVAAAWYGLQSQTPSLLVFHVGDGVDRVHKVTIKGSGERARTLLNKSGFTQRTMLPTSDGWEVLIFDPNGRETQAVKTFATAVGGNLKTVEGEGRIIGNSKDSLADEGARRSYRSIIKNYEQEKSNGSIQPQSTNSQRVGAPASTHATIDTPTTPIPATASVTYNPNTAFAY